MPVARTRGTYRKTARRREEILDAAFLAFSQSGFANTTMSEIARRVDLTLPGLTHHFPTKVALMESVLERRDLGAKSLLDTRSGVDFLDGFVAIAERDEADRDLTRLFTILAAEATDPGHPMHQYFRERYELILGYMEQAFEEAQLEGVIRAAIPPAEGARALVALLAGLQVQSLYDLPGAPPPSSTIRDMLPHLLNERSETDG